MDLNLGKKKRMSHFDIIKNYKSGKRDFTNIICRAGWFNDLDLSGINFSNSDLSFSSFSNSTLISSKFINSDLKWSDLSKTNLSGTIFIEADLSWSAIIESIINNKTDFSDANLNYIVAFGTDIRSGRTQGMKMSSALLRIEDVGSNPNFALNALEKSNVPGSVKNLIRKQIIEINERARSIKNLLPRSYRKNELKLPSRDTESNINQNGSVYGGGTAYEELSTYVPRSEYKQKINYG
ncbi:MAG: hypothetical protein GF368_04235 [Candidatus Aenigmarchaeota archaeon]|nr:hypothetical protein [Candidatus Aenigmarchaeota archaeon]